jgi:hypothetical protein
MLHPGVIQAGTRPAAEGESPHVPNVPMCRAPHFQRLDQSPCSYWQTRLTGHYLPGFSGRRDLPEATCHSCLLLSCWARPPLHWVAPARPAPRGPFPPADVRLHAPKGNHGMDADSDSVLRLQLELCILTCHDAILKENLSRHEPTTRPL